MSTCQTINIQHKIEEEAKLLNDTPLLCKISAIGDFIAKEIKYHRSCRQEYADKAKSIIKENTEKQKSSWQRKKDICERAFTAAISFIETKIIYFGDVQRMSDLLNQYFLALEGLGLSDTDLDLEKKRKSVLEQKILMHFKDKLKTFIHPTIGVGKIVFQSTLSMDEALSTKFDAVKKIPVKVTV